jgi:hypothetical protein
MDKIVTGHSIMSGHQPTFQRELTELSAAIGLVQDHGVQEAENQQKP